MEPLTTLAVAGIGWIATKSMDGIAEGAADRVFVNTVGGIRERLAALAGRPEGDDLARGVRQAQLHALERLILNYRAQRPLARLGGGSDPFVERAMEFCRSAAEQPLLRSSVGGDALLALAPASADWDGRAAGAAAMEEAVLAELASTLDGIPVPAGFVDHLRKGARETPRFVELFRTYLEKQVTQDAAFREVLHTGLLMQNAANLAALGDWLAQVEARFGGALERLETGVVEFAAKNEAWFVTILKAVEDKRVSVVGLRDILEKLGETSVPDEDILDRLSAKADEYLALSEELSALIKATPKANAVLSEGKQLLDAGDLDGARRLFAGGHVALRATREEHAREEATLLAAEAGIDRLQLRYREAADRYAEAEKLVASFDPDARFDYLCRRARSLHHCGDQFGDLAALFEAVSLWRHAAQLRPRPKSSLEWAMIQNNLGNTLQILGTRKSRTALLEEAVCAYHAALEERTLERVPGDWAVTQSNLGAALQTLGRHESGTARLVEAVEAYRAALEVQDREPVRLAWAATQNNLGNALRVLGEREGGTARLEEAIAAFRAALDVRTPERVPLQCATTQINLGVALRSLGERERDTARLKEAMEVLHSAAAAFEAAGADHYVKVARANLERTQQLLEPVSPTDASPPAGSS